MTAKVAAEQEKTKSQTNEETSKLQDTTETSQLLLDDAALGKIADDILGGTNGLADIFNEGNASGLYDATTAKAQSEDLLTKLSGELAKLTGKTVNTFQAEESTTAEQRQKSQRTKVSAEAGT